MSGTGSAPDGARDEVTGVVWDVPDGSGGWVSEAACWFEGCDWRTESRDRDEVERLLGDHRFIAHHVQPRPKAAPPYPVECRHPERCAGLTSCPRDKSCID